MRICHHCGNKINADQKYCDNCGEKVSIKNSRTIFLIGCFLFLIALGIVLFLIIGKDDKAVLSKDNERVVSELEQKEEELLENDHKFSSSSKIIDTSSMSAENKKTKKEGVSKAVKEKISNYIEEICCFNQCGFPNDFSDITQLNKSWILIHQHWIEDKFIMTQKYLGISLRDVEAAARKNLNPNIVLPISDTKYQSIEIGTVENDCYFWPSIDFICDNSIPYITDIYQSNGYYYVSVIELAGRSQNGQDTPGDLYVQDAETKDWTIKVGTTMMDEVTYEEKLIFDAPEQLDLLPKKEYILQENEEGGFYLIAKKGFDNVGTIGIDTDEDLLNRFRKAHPEYNKQNYFVCADFDQDKKREMFLFVETDTDITAKFAHGDIWYIDEEKIMNLHDQNDFITEEFTEDSLKVIRLHGKLYLVVSTIYPEGSYVYVFNVQNGIPKQQAHGEGSFEIINDVLSLERSNMSMTPEMENDKNTYIPPQFGMVRSEYYTSDAETGNLKKIPGVEISYDTYLKYDEDALMVKFLEDIVIGHTNFDLGKIIKTQRGAFILRENAVLEINYLCSFDTKINCYQYAVCPINLKDHDAPKLENPIVLYGNTNVGY